MKKRTRIACMFACLLSTCMTLTPLSVNAAEPLSAMSDDAILLSTGMPAAEVYAMDEDFKEYIADSLINSGELDEITYIPTEEIVTPVPYGEQVLTGIEFSVSAFKSAGTVHIYPTYEMTTARKPIGNDCFAISFTEDLEPYEFGGQIWYRYTYSEPNDWESGGSMTGIAMDFHSGKYVGDQLGTPDGSMYFKGCAYVQADEISNVTPKILMKYVYSPAFASYEISVGSFLGINIIPTGWLNDIYVATSTNHLYY